MHHLLRSAGILGLATSAMAADLTWTGAASSDWNNRLNWTITGTSTVASAPPDASSAVIIPAGTTAGVADPGDFGSETPIFAKSLTVAGALNLNQGTGSTVLTLTSDLVLSGTGTINLGSATVTPTTGMSGFLTFTSPTATISGTGKIIVGLEDFIRPSRLQIVPGGTLTIATGVTIQGGRLQIERTDVNSQAVTGLVLSQGATLELAAGGSTTFDGIDVLNNGTIRLANTSYLSLPQANYTQGSTGVLDVTIGAGVRAFIDQAQAVTLDGTLIANLVNGYLPSAGSSFTIANTLNAGTLANYSNSAGNLSSPALNPNTGELQVTYTYNVQTIFFPALANTIATGGADVPLLATTTATGLPITYSIALVQNPDGTTNVPLSSSLNGSNLRPGSAAETVKITASAPAGTVNGVSYAAESTSQNVIIHQNQVISINGLPASVSPGDSFSLSAVPSITSWLGNSVSPTWAASSNSSVATVNASGLVTAVAKGTAVLTVNTPAIGSFLLAGSKSITLTVAPRVQAMAMTAPGPTVSVTLAPAPAVTSATFTATYQSSSKTGTWASSNTAVATVSKVTDSGGVTTALVTYVGAGTATITFSSPADATYAAGTASCEVTVNADPKTIFTTRFYQQILGRSPDAAGLASWVSALTDGSKAGADLAYGFILSPEFTNRGLGNGDYVATLYQAFFGRAYDQGGYDGWLAQLNSGIPREDVLYGFVYAQEFTNLASSYGITQAGPDINRRRTVRAFVARFYTEILGRVQDTAGLADWTNQLLDGVKTGENVAQGFIFSQEFVNRNTTDDQFVNMLYKAFFNRTADAGGYNVWFTALQNKTMTRAQVLNGFLRAQEFINLCSASNILPFAAGG